ncbi:MAG TPA: hypothetical protein DEF89_03400 [Desulfosporosinus sp.]|nr:hypothetical protein [Desulfosporosinus sp.]
MCTEKDPIDCHRSILVGRAFDDEKFDVSNIHEDGSAETQEELIERQNLIKNRQQDYKTFIMVYYRKRVYTDCT